VQKGPKPAGQPRTLRTIAESKNASGAFMPEAPRPDENWRKEYKDSAQTGASEKLSSAGGYATKAEPQPFKIKGGKS